MASILKKVTVWFFAHMKNTLKNGLFGKNAPLPLP